MAVKDFTLSQKTLNELFEYKVGKLYWKVSRGSRKAGAEVGTTTPLGYLQTKVGGKLYLVHRLIYLMHYGCLPKFIDHKDGVKTNNKIRNLREASAVSNQYNRGLPSNNTSGVKGVYWNKAKEKWKAQCNVDGSAYHIGYFDDINKAEQALIQFRKKYHGMFAKHK
jgi:hypothetical protein